MENWKPIKGYEGIYEVSDFGRVKRLANSNRCKRDRILNPKPNHNGYIRVKLTNNGVSEKVFVHRLVLIAFVGNPLSEQETLHVDNNRQNNILGNLRWGSRQENADDRANSTGFPHGETAVVTSVLTKEEVREIRRLTKIGLGQKRLAKQFGVSRTTIKNIQFGRRWQWLDN